MFSAPISFSPHHPIIISSKKDYKDSNNNNKLTFIQVPGQSLGAFRLIPAAFPVTLGLLWFENTLIFS